MSRSDAYITVSCDGDSCRESVEIPLTATGRGYDERSVDSDLENLGWTDQDGDLCPWCSREEDEDE